MQGLYNVCLMLPTLNLSERDLVHLLGELEAASLLTNINTEGIELEWKNLSHITALYCLFCIFEAQPRRPCVLVRIQEHHCSIFQSTFTESCTQARHRGSIDSSVSFLQDFLICMSMPMRMPGMCSPRCG